MFDHEQAIKAYTGLMQRVSAGAYDELEPDGSYKPGGDNVLKDLDRLEWKAYRAGLKFVHHEDGTYTLEPMTEEEKAAYLAAVIEEEENSADEYIMGLKHSRPAGQVE
jgi:hypothetical protein